MKAFQHLAIVALLAVGCSGSSGQPDTVDVADDAVVVDTAVTHDDGAEAVADAGRDAAIDVAGNDLPTGDLSADEGSPTDVANDVDGDPDGVADDVAHDTADEIGTDVPDDAAPGDVAADQGADVANVGFCANPDDQSIILGDAAAVDAAARDCYLECMGKPEPQMCNIDCISTNTGLSSDCAGCYTGRFECTAVNCLMPCTQDFGSEACLACQDEFGCTAAFQDCAGT